MTNNELLQELKETTGFQLTDKNDYGSISRAANIANPLMSNIEYLYKFYPEMKRRIDNLPWQTGRPTEPGKYITVADCNEHEITHNWLNENGYWGWLDRHIIGWMPVPQMNDEPISIKKDNKYFWKDGGQPLW